MRRSIIGLAFLAASAGTVLAQSATVYMRPHRIEFKVIQPAGDTGTGLTDIAADKALLSEASARAGFGRSIPENSAERMAAVYDLAYELLQEELAARVPVHTPEWTNHNVSDPGLAKIGRWVYGSPNRNSRMGMPLAAGISGTTSDVRQQTGNLDMPLAGGVSGTTSDVLRQASKGGTRRDAQTIYYRLAATSTPDQPLWVAIRNLTEAILFGSPAAGNDPGRGKIGSWVFASPTRDSRLGRSAPGDTDSVREAFDAAMLPLTASSGNPGDTMNTLVKEFSPAEEQLKGKPRH